MEHQDKLLVTLTVKQFSEITKKMVAEEVERIMKEIQESVGLPEKETEFCDVDQASKITKLTKATIYSKVSLLQIPCLSRGKPLIFSRSHLEGWIRAGRPKTDSVFEIEKALKEN